VSSDGAWTMVNAYFPRFFSFELFFGVNVIKKSLRGVTAPKKMSGK
jgi:hypothetical protein